MCERVHRVDFAPPTRTAYDTQSTKGAYSDDLTPEQADALAISGALDLYLDFVNLFRFLLYFLGEGEE